MQYQKELVYIPYSDNGIYTSKKFLKELYKKGQGIWLSGTRGYHQNRVAKI